MMGIRTKKKAISRAHRRSLLKTTLKWVSFFLVILIICLHVSVKFWLGPAYIAARIEQALAGLWSGPVRVDEIDFRYDGIMFVSGINFCDRAGAVVMRATGVELVLGDWPSLTSHARIIKMNHLDVWLRMEDGSLNLPVQAEQSQETGPPSLEYMGIKSITLRAASGRSETVFDNLSADMTRGEGIYTLSIGNKGINDSYQIKIDGVFNLANGGVDLGLQFAQKTTPDEMKVFLSAMGMPENWGCYGQVDAELSVRGKFSDTESLWPEGIVTFKDWTILENRRTIVSDANGVLEVTHRRLDLKEVEGAVCGGYVSGALYLDIRQSGPTVYGGDVEFKKIDMAKLTELAETPKKFSKGTGLLRLEFYGDVNAPDEVRAYGKTLVEDADLWKVSLIAELFKNIGAQEYNIGGLSDAEMIFRLWGPRMMIERAHLSNSFSAIEVEQGGRINLKTREIDMHVVGVPLKLLEKIIGKIPVANWFMNFKDKLIRLQIKGYWTDPTSKLIRKEPITDIEEATMGFFVDIAKSGGNITNGLKKALGFEQDKDNEKK